MILAKKRSLTSVTLQTIEQSVNAMDKNVLLASNKIALQELIS